MKIFKKSRKAACFFLALLIIFLVIFVKVSWQDLTPRYYTVNSDKINNQIRIIQLSDLHSTFFGDNQEELLEAIAEAEPDIICFTGDIADDDVSHEGTRVLAEAVGKKYKCYYVSGNHEKHAPEGLEWVKTEIFEKNGIEVLDPGIEELIVNDEKISICGLDDIEVTGYDKWLAQLKDCSERKSEDAFSVLLYHRPERTSEFSECSFDLILCGHAHGGQIIIPGICNGIIAPNQGIFPKYAGGEYDLGDTKMIVSRGLVKNIFPRTFNPPELVIIDIV